MIDNVRGNRAKELLEHISELFTKEEIIAMLTEIELEIEEKDADLRYCGHNLMAVDCIDIIQQKINSLKE